MSKPDYDVAIIGGGHNGLVCAAYLAKAGRSVIVLEKSRTVGGAAITEEFHPGFRNSVASYTVSLLNPQVIADLELARFGLQIIERPVANYWPTPEGAGLLMPYGLTARQEAISAYSARDAAASAAAGSSAAVLFAPGLRISSFRAARVSASSFLRASSSAFSRSASSRS